MRDAEYYRLRAEESRAIQDILTDLRNKDMLQKVIDDYEAMADIVDGITSYQSLKNTR